MNDEEKGLNATLLGTKPGGVLVKLIGNKEDFETNQKLIKERIEAALGKGLNISFQ